MEAIRHYCILLSSEFPNLVPSKSSLKGEKVAFTGDRIHNTKARHHEMKYQRRIARHWNAPVILTLLLLSGSMLIVGQSSGVTSSNSSQFPDPSYLERSGNVVHITHSLPMSVKIDDQFRFISGTNYQPTFDGAQFNVSIMAFANKNDFIMIHAERHTDGSGGLNYSKYPSVQLNNLNFNVRQQCADIDEATIKEEHDLKLLLDGGFRPAPAIYLAQYFATSVDGTSEIVISYGRRLKDCSANIINTKLKRKIDLSVRRSVKMLSAKSD